MAELNIQYFTKFKHFHKFLKDLTIRVLEHGLKRITNNLADSGNHKYYEIILKTLIPIWQIDIKEAKFIGVGIGDGSLDTHRKVTIGNKLYFEKVHFNSYQDLQKVQWFQNHIYELIKDKIKVPRVQKTYRGKLLTIVYYDYFNLTKLGNKSKESSLIQFSKALYQISCMNKSDLDELELPESIKGFKNHFQYQRNITLAGAELAKHGIDLKAIEKLVEHSKCVLTHGDLNEGNGYKKEALIDWDLFGIYPIGFDPAYIYFRLPVKNNLKVMNWLKQHYSNVVSEKDWSTFERNFIYFLFIFSIYRFDKEPYSYIEQELIENLKYYNEPVPV
jgi:hypothetical protein